MKWDNDQIDKISMLLYRIVIQRHKVKMAYFDANCEDKPLLRGLSKKQLIALGLIHSIEEEIKEDDLTEDQLDDLRQRRVEERYLEKQKAEKMTRVLDDYIDKLTENSKLKEMLKEPINVTKEKATNFRKFLYYNEINFQLDE